MVVYDRRKYLSFGRIKLLLVRLLQFASSKPTALAVLYTFWRDRMWCHLHCKHFTRITYANANNQ